MTIIMLSEEPPLLQAVFRGSPDEVRSLLYKKEDVNYQDVEKRSSLHCAAFQGEAEIAELLILAGARVNIKDNRWLTPLHRACCSSSEAVVEILLKHHADINARDKNWQTPLHVAAANNSLDCSRLLIPVLGNINMSDRGGRTALHHAAFNGHYDMVRLLLEKGAQVNAYDKRERYAVHWAAYMGHRDTVHLLVEHGADLSCRDKEMYTPLHTAAAAGQEEAILDLVTFSTSTSEEQEMNNGSDTRRVGSGGKGNGGGCVEVDAVSSRGDTPLHVACANGHEGVLSRLIICSASVTSTNHKRRTPLHLAAASTEGGACLETLVRHEADANAKCEGGRTPLHMTALHGRFKRAETLIHFGALVNMCDSDGNTPLHLAARGGHELLIETLLSRGADPNIRGSSGMLAIHVASLYGHYSCCGKLVESMTPMVRGALDGRGRSLLHAAACGGNIQCVKFFIQMGCEVNLLDDNGRLALHYAAAGCHYVCFTGLLKEGSNATVHDSRGCNVLHYAAANDSEGKIVSHILERTTVNPRSRDIDDHTALHYAALSGYRRPLEMILDKIAGELQTNSGRNPATTPLHLAAYHGHLGALSVLLNYVMNPDMKDNKGRTPLDLAAYKGHFKALSTLVGRGASIWMQDDDSQRTPLHAAAFNGHTECLEQLLESSDEPSIVDCMDFSKRTPLMWAVVNGHPDSAMLLLSRDANPDIRDCRGMTALHRGAATGQEECVDALMQHGVDPTVRDTQGRTPLHLAAAGGHAGMVGALLQYVESGSGGGQGSPNKNLATLVGAGPVEDRLGYTPLHWACYNGHDSCVEMLLDSPAHRSFTGNSFSPLHCAALNGNDTCTELLLEANHLQDITSLVDHCGRCPMHVAALGDHCESLQLLHSAAMDSQNGPDINLQDSKGLTPIMVACLNGHVSSIEVLLEYEPELNLCDESGSTCLHLACLSGNESAVLSILDKIDTADITNKANKDGQIALHHAAREGMPSAVQLLIAKGSSVMTADSEGLTPALACARNKDVAECLAVILAHAFPCSPSPGAMGSGHTVGMQTTSSTKPLLNSTTEPTLGGGAGLEDDKCKGRLLESTRDLSSSAKSCLSDESDQFF